MKKYTESADLTQLKQSIGFGTAFKVTLGFYAAQFVATLLGLATITVVFTTLYWIFK